MQVVEVSLDDRILYHELFALFLTCHDITLCFTIEWVAKLIAAKFREPVSEKNGV